MNMYYIVRSFTSTTAQQPQVISMLKPLGSRCLPSISPCPERADNWMSSQLALFPRTLFSIQCESRISHPCTRTSLQPSCTRMKRIAVVLTSESVPWTIHIMHAKMTRNIARYFAWIYIYIYMKSKKAVVISSKVWTHANQPSIYLCQTHVYHLWPHGKRIIFYF